MSWEPRRREMQQRVAGIEKTAAAIREVGDHDPGLKEGVLGQLTEIRCERIAFLKTDGKVRYGTRNFASEASGYPECTLLIVYPGKSMLRN